jgi:hypothetical protein
VPANQRDMVTGLLGALARMHPASLPTGSARREVRCRRMRLWRKRWRRNRHATQPLVGALHHQYCRI